MFFSQQISNRTGKRVHTGLSFIQTSVQIEVFLPFLTETVLPFNINVLFSTDHATQVSHQVCASQTDSRTLHVFHFNNAPFSFQLPPPFTQKVMFIFLSVFDPQATLLFALIINLPPD